MTVKTSQILTYDQILYEKYKTEGYKAVLCRGYHPKYNQLNGGAPTPEQYKKAKEAFEKGYTEPDFTQATYEKINEHHQAGGLIGWLLPKGVIALDVDKTPDDPRYFEGICQSKGIKPGIHGSPYGKHGLFKKTDRDLTGRDKVFTRSGLEVTYRIGGRNYLILDPGANRKWELWIPVKDLPELPGDFLPYDRKNKSEVLNCLAWQVGGAKRKDIFGTYEDLQGFMALLIENGVSEDDIRKAFELVFLSNYDEKKTLYYYERTKAKLEAGDHVIGAGTFIQRAKELDLNLVLRFAGELTGKGKQAPTDTSTLTGPTITDQELIPVVPFPFEILPSQMVEEINQIARAKNVDPELVACGKLTILSGAIGNTIRIQAKEGHSVTPFLWLIALAESGYGKTPTMNELSRPIYSKEADAEKAFQKEWAVYKNGLKKEMEENPNNLSKKPRRQEYYVNDFTIEALADSFENNPRGLISDQDEIAALIMGLNQYKGKGNDREHYLALFNCNPWKINRKKEGTRFIPNTGLAIIGGIQPNKMIKTFQADCFDDGLIPRFLFFNAKEHTYVYTLEEVGELSFWSLLIEEAYKMPICLNDQGFVVPKIVKLGEKAKEKWISFYNDLGALMPYLSQRSRIFVPKLLGYYSLKFVGLLHFIKSVSEKRKMNNTIDPQTMEGAIKLTQYFVGQAMLTVKLYTSEPELNGFEKRVIQTLFSLQSQAKNGKLKLSNVTELFNSGLPETAKHTPERISKLVKQLGLRTEISTGGYSCIIWEPEKVENLFSKITSTTSTTSTSLRDARGKTVEVENRTSTTSTMDEPNDRKIVEVVEVEKTTSTNGGRVNKGEVEEVEEVEVCSEINLDDGEWEFNE